MLAGREHLDDRYLHAVNYPVKSSRDAYPKMVLVGDIVSDDEEALERVTQKVVSICQSTSDCEGFIARTDEERFRFWHERSRTAAISAHTNAFKLNEDVVIPLDKSATTRLPASASTSAARLKTRSPWSTSSRSTSRATSRSASPR